MYIGNIYSIHTTYAALNKSLLCRYPLQTSADENVISNNGIGRIKARKHFHMH